MLLARICGKRELLLCRVERGVQLRTILAGWLGLLDAAKLAAWAGRPGWLLRMLPNIFNSNFSPKAI